ncbi:MAG: hydrogenase maturation protease [Acidimicrobiales bacterium]
MAPCRVLVGGYGSPACRDLDFGERFIRLAEAYDWPDGVVVEDLSYSAHLVLHRLQELRPQKVVLVGAVARGVDRPGTVRRYRLGAFSPDDGEVHDSLVEAVGGRVGLENMLSVVRHFGGLPSDTVVVEVEAADSSFGLGFSDELAAAIDPVLEVVRDELGDVESDPREAAVPTRVAPVAAGPGPAAEQAAGASGPGIEQLFQYAQAHAQLRALQGLSERLPARPGLSVAARFVPGDSGLGLSGDWYDVVSLASGAVGVVVADVAGGCGLHASSVTAQLKMAVQALAMVEGDHPGALVGHLDRLVAATDVGAGSTLTYLTLDPAEGTLRVASSGHCPPLVLRPDGSGSFLEVGRSPALGSAADPIEETVVQLEPGTTIVVFTDGLASSPTLSRAGGLRLVQHVAEREPRALDDLCDHLLASCVTLDGAAGEDDASVLAIRLGT